MYPWQPYDKLQHTMILWPDYSHWNTHMIWYFLVPIDVLLG